MAEAVEACVGVVRCRKALSSRQIAVVSVCVCGCRVGNQEGDLVGGRLAVEEELGVGSRESRIVGRVL